MVHPLSIQSCSKNPPLKSASFWPLFPPAYCVHPVIHKRQLCTQSVCVCVCACVCVCMRVCMQCACVHVCTYACVRMRMHVCACAHECACISANVCMPASLCIQLYVCVCVCVYVRKPVCADTMFVPGVQCELQKCGEKNVMRESFNCTQFKTTLQA